MGWSEKISATPSEVNKEVCFNPSQVNQWIQSQPSPQARELAIKMIKNTRIVCKEEFNAALNCSVQSFEKALNGDEYIAVVTRQGSSNRWMFEKTISSLSKLPIEVGHIHKIRSISQKYPEVHHIALFDDASYY